MAMNIYRRWALHETNERRGRELDDMDDELIVEKMQGILSAHPCIGVPSEPSVIVGTVYLGTSANAENLAMMKSMGISYILNCAGIGSAFKFRRIKEMYATESYIQGYQELIIDDSDDSNIRSHFDRAHAFINYARERQCRVLIHCPGVSRAGAIAISYLMRNGTTLMKATKIVKDCRRCALTNVGFMEQLVAYAREKGMLDPDLEDVMAPRYGRKIDSYRINSAHLPMFL